MVISEILRKKTNGCALEKGKEATPCIRQSGIGKSPVFSPLLRLIPLRLRESWYRHGLPLLYGARCASYGINYHLAIQMQKNDATLIGINHPLVIFISAFPRKKYAIVSDGTTTIECAKL
jgi:hypothetical protein